jgi:prephenate dehydrogenase
VDGLALGGRGLKDTTRLASSPVDIWRDIASTNQDNIAQAIDEFIEVLLSLKPGSRATDDPMGTVFESAARWKRVLESGRERA